MNSTALVTKCNCGGWKVCHGSPEPLLWEKLMYQQTLGKQVENLSLLRMLKMFYFSL